MYVDSNCEHEFNFDSVETLDRENTNNIREILETWYSGHSVSNQQMYRHRPNVSTNEKNDKRQKGQRSSRGTANRKIYTISDTTIKGNYQSQTTSSEQATKSLTERF
ncbi:unnamed protein product [Heterobilharzia americana]|nr:unnamed protein product [Heterobilharzia americana]